jgi:formate hydrogenlyase subunit 3/multisubunit Na+/H+ antiporter MnhD subunit
MIIGAVTIVAAVMMAMVQHDLKKLLSYHAISQVGYMVLGIGTLTPIGIAGGLFHMLNNAIYKSCLFLGVGIVEKKTNSTEIGELGGLGKTMPITFVTFLIAALAISGIPPLNGFVSKWLIYQGIIETGKGINYIFLIAAMFGSALTLASFIKAIYSVFLGRKTEKTASVKKETSFFMWLPVAILSILCLFFGIYYVFPLDNFIYPGIGIEASFQGIWDSTLATLLIIAGLVLGLVIYFIGSVVKKSRVADTFIGGETLEPDSARISAEHFYNTVKEVPALNKLYKTQEKGYIDPYVIFGKIGYGFTWLLRKLHSGLLPLYLSWSLLGSVVLIILFVFLL